MTPVQPLALVGAALLLLIERGAYVWIWNYPTTFRAWCAHPMVQWIGGSVEVVRALFVIFKLVQAGVFLGWFWIHGHGQIVPTDSPGAAITGILLLLVGQTLNLGVFARIGTTGVFYGNRFGHVLPWVDSFPFSIVSHPQYVGTVLSIWGLFIIVRFPHHDWFVLPLIESVYYAIGSYFESDAP